MMQVTQRKTQSANRVVRLRFAAQVAEQTLKVGARIAQEREARGWSRPEFARRLPGVSTGNDVYRWETGKHMPRADTLDAIAALFNVDIADLYAGPQQAAAEKSSDFIGSLTEAQVEIDLPQRVADALDALRAEMGEKLDRLYGELESLKRMQASSDRTRKRSGS